MKLFGLIFALIFTLNAHATYIPQGCSGQIIGSMCIPKSEWDRMITGSTSAGGGTILTCRNTTAGRGTGCRDAVGTYFQVGGSVTLTCKYAVGNSYGATGAFTSGSASPAYSDASVGDDIPSPGTNPVYYGGSGGSLMGVSTNMQTYWTGKWTAPSSKYIFFASGQGAMMITFYCLID
jgi:hypothetical protein